MRTTTPPRSGDEGQKSLPNCARAKLYPFNFKCELHVLYCNSMKCPCVCINLLLEHFRKKHRKPLSEEPFQYLPTSVQKELKGKQPFCLKLCHPVFIRENGQQIITQRITNNQELFVQFPTTQQELTAEVDDTLVQPRKTSNTHKGLRYLGQGETPGGATTSPDKANRRREGQ